MKFKLTKGQRIDPFWLVLKPELEKEIERLRRKNDDAKLTQEQTSALRGRIAALKDLLAIGEDAALADSE